MFLKISQNLQNNANNGVSVAGPLPESLFKKGPRQRCDFCKIFKSTFFYITPPSDYSGSSGRYLKTYQNDINWGNNSNFNANTEHILVFCKNFRSRNQRSPPKILEIFKRNVCSGVSDIVWNYNIVPWL